MKKKWAVYRETYSTIEIEAETKEEAIDVMSDLDGDDDGWDYYKEEMFIEPDVSYDEYSMTHTVDRDDDVNEGKSLTVSTWISSLNDMDRILLNRIEALEEEIKKINSAIVSLHQQHISFKKHVSNRMLYNIDKIGELEQLTQKLIDIEVTEDVDRHDDLIDELWNHKK